MTPPHRLLCSTRVQATAKLLTDAGKSKWLTQREDKIVAKGKMYLIYSAFYTSNWKEI